MTVGTNNVGKQEAHARRTKIQERAMGGVFFVAALASVFAVAMICVFLLGEGIPAIGEIGVRGFLLGTDWSPSNIPPSFGIFPMIVGSVLVTLGAVILGVPIGIFSAVYLSYSCPPRLYRFLKPGVDLLAGIPSVVYGFFGMAALTPLLGSSMLSASVLLGIMILPTVITLSENALRAIPGDRYEGALALGAKHYRSVFGVVLPAARSGVIAAIILGLGRAIGETMAVIMVAGNQARMPEGLLDGVRTMTANIVLEMGYASGMHRRALIATGAVLFVFILLIDLCVPFITRGRNAGPLRKLFKPKAGNAL
ncbi:MAG: phosphate ABC transporter permease subunit PstC [Clostridiales Family XIII bacterium]|jgi:phosphate transport system permease protein|nr:phosphate ABC transporter permease subunit PstC [Clostridiales Family XIII bacterium]